MMVELKRISTASFGLLASPQFLGALGSQSPAPRANQVTADSVASTLRASRDLAGYRIEIQARDGVVTLTGELGSPAQKAEALARGRQYVAGVFAAWLINCRSRTTALFALSSTSPILSSTSPILPSTSPIKRWLTGGAMGWARWVAM